MQSKEHWETVYTTKSVDRVSWYQPHADKSMQLIRESGVSRNAAIMDVGGGASTLVDDLLADGYGRVTVLDLSSAALAESQRRLGPSAERVQWTVADVTMADFAPHSVDLWHDRAVFHFLTAVEERAAYVRQVLRAVKPGGHVIVATFGSDGPLQCSGLPVMRYAPGELHAEFGEPFAMLAHDEQVHHTPFGTDQQFIYCMCRKLTG
jgi:ubiquinone/menaquinone biosynthesis C-methylase UbiE